MTVLAYRDGILAADRLGLRCGTKSTANKIHRVHDGWMAGAGSTASVLEMVNWYRAGANPKDLPSRQRTEENDVLMLMNKQGVFVFERGPYPIPLAQPWLALGSGAEYATTALYLGKSAREAVEITSQLCSTCGNGVDWVTLGMHEPEH